MKKLILVVALILASCHQEVSMDLCDQDFRDTWWEVDKDIVGTYTENTNACIRTNSSGTMEMYDANGYTYDTIEWTCINTDTFKVGAIGSFSVRKINDDAYLVDVNTLLKKDKVLVKACSFSWIYEY